MSMRALILSVSAILATGSSPCTAFSFCNEHHRACCATSSSPSSFFRIFSLSATSSSSGSGDESTASSVNTITTQYETTLAADRGGIKYTSRLSRLRKIFRKNNNADHDNNESKRYCFTYDCDEMILGSDSDDTAINKKPSTTKTTTAVMLIHPIGVGIGRWYHDRLLASLQERYNDIEHRLVFVSPDLLGSATASGPVDATTNNNNGESTQKFPLLNITDWTDQVTQLMADYEAKGEKEGHPISSWSIVANGGCAPIALQVASTSAIQNNNSSPLFKAALTNVIISSPPRLPFFLEGSDQTKVQKSYRTLSGITGRLFWWYALRKNGTFIQKFSERNLVGDASKLGEKWTPNCVKSAKLHGGQSRYSTFAFLAGTLQDGCVDSLTTLKDSNITIDILRGTDKRRNRAKSWFWSSSRKKQTAGSSNSSRSAKEEDSSGTDTTKQTDNATMPTTTSTTPKEEEESIQQYYYASKPNNNGNRGGKEVFIGGRISLAWEDSDGYAKSLMELLTV